MDKWQEEQYEDSKEMRKEFDEILGKHDVSREDKDTLVSLSSHMDTSQ